MKATRFIVAITVMLGCHAGNDDRTTTFVTRASVLDAFLNASCTHRSFARELSDSSSPELTRREYVARCLPKPELGSGSWLHLRWVSNIAVTKEGEEICRVEIGPDPIKVAMNPEFIASMFRDPERQEKVRRVLADNVQALSKELRLVADIDGVSLHVNQFNSIDGPNVLIEADGCERLGRSALTVDPGAPLAYSNP